MRWTKKGYKTRKENLDYYVNTPVGELNIYDLSQDNNTKHNFQLTFRDKTISFGNDLGVMMDMGESVLRSLYNELGGILTNTKDNE